MLAVCLRKIKGKKKKKAYFQGFMETEWNMRACMPPFCYSGREKRVSFIAEIC